MHSLPHHIEFRRFVVPSSPSIKGRRRERRFKVLILFYRSHHSRPEFEKIKNISPNSSSWGCTLWQHHSHMITDLINMCYVLLLVFISIYLCIEASLTKTVALCPQQYHRVEMSTHQKKKTFIRRRTPLCIQLSEIAHVTYQTGTHLHIIIFIYINNKLIPDFIIIAQFT